MKGLIYPLIGVAVIVLVTLVAAALISALNDHRRRHAIATARWEPFTEINADGQVTIGVAHIARWGRRSETLARSKRTETFDAEDVTGRIEAFVRAESRADTYNSIGAGGTSDD